MSTHVFEETCPLPTLPRKRERAFRQERRYSLSRLRGRVGEGAWPHEEAKP